MYEDHIFTNEASEKPLTFLLYRSLRMMTTQELWTKGVVRIFWYEDKQKKEQGVGAEP